MFNAITIFGVILVACLATSVPIGGYEDVDVDDETVRTVAEEATRKLSETSNEKYHYSLVRVVKAQKQVVQDLSYKLDIIVGQTTCEKTSEYDPECEFQDNENTYKKCWIFIFKSLFGGQRHFAASCHLVSKNEI